MKIRLWRYYCTAITLSFGCGEGGQHGVSSNVPEPSPVLTFEKQVRSRPDLEEQVLTVEEFLEPVGDAYQVDGRRVRTHDSRRCLLWDEEPFSETSVVPESIVICTEGNELKLTYRPGRPIADMVFLPDGRLYIAELWSKADSARGFHLQLVHLSDEGEVLNTRFLEDKPTPAELLFYSFDGSADPQITVEEFEAPADDRPLVWLNTELKMIAFQDELYVFGLTYGIKLYKIDPESLEVKDDLQVMPDHTFLSTLFITSDVQATFSPTGELYVASEIQCHFPR